MSEINDIETLNGVFVYKIYSSYNYAVYRFLDSEDGNIVVTGDIKDIDMNQEYILHGQYVEHQKYGFQFTVYNIEAKLPSSYEGIISYLSSPLFKGIGKKKAEKIVKYLGENALNIIKENPLVLEEINISFKDINIISSILNANLKYEDSFYYLISLGLSIKDINRIIELYKEETINIVKENPYKLYYDIYGLGFKKCDNLAIKIAYDKNSINRAIAYLSYIINELSFKTGNTYFSYLELKNVYYNNTDLDLAFDDVLKEAINDKRIVEDDDRYYAYQQYVAEKEIADFLFKNNQHGSFDINIIDELLKQIQIDSAITYDDKQKEALYNFYKNKISLIVGGPGTGKTTIVKALVNTIKETHPTYELHVVAPTGRSSKRISELCNVNASTIHSLLKWNKETNTFNHGIDNPLLVDILIIDEFSMVDNWLFYKLISALYNVKKICIIGDDNQLPSVGAGNLLKDLISSNMFPITRLKTIFRQGDNSSIIALSNDILNDSINFNNYGEEIIFLEGDEIILRNKLIKIMQDYINEGYSINDLQVLSPMYKGNLGIDYLNAIMQDIFNPQDTQKKEIKMKYKIYREGDKIIQLKNQNSDDIFNGDIGYIQEINLKDHLIIGKYDDILIDYNPDELNKIALAYTISVHKAQGSEYPIVFLSISNSHNIMLNRNLLYTAVSRASSRLVILGNKELFINAAKRSIKIRKTSLMIYLDKLIN